MDLNDFISKFHNLPGTSIGEKRKHCFLLLANLPLDHDALIASITPRTRLESLFTLELLLRLQRIPELLQVLKQEDEYLPGKLLKNAWFCRTLASVLDDSSAGFVDGVLPFTSFLIRKRIMAKLAIYGTRLDGLYDEVSTRYGVASATDLLVACTAAKIASVFAARKVVLQPHQQKLLYRKHPQLFPLYLSQADVDRSVVRYIARRDLGGFLTLSDQFAHLEATFGQRQATFGKRLTRKFVTDFKELVITKADVYSCWLHLKIVVKMLSDGDMRRFFFKCLPPAIDGGSTGYHNVRWRLGKRFYKLFLEGARVVYEKNLYDYPDLIRNEMLADMDLDEREKWIEIKRKHGTDENDLIEFMKISDSVPLFKNQIIATSKIDRRGTLIQRLVESCKINNDLNALAEIGEYICFRHSDDHKILSNFLFKLREDFQLERLEDRHWKSIDTILKILKPKNDWPFFKYYDFYLKYVEFLFREKRLTNEEIVHFLRSVEISRHWDYKTSSEELRKLLILKSIDLIHDVLRLIWEIFEWNKGHLSDKIDIFQYPRLVQTLQTSIQDAINSNEYNPQMSYLENVFEKIICVQEHSEFRQDVIKKYFLVGLKYYNSQIDLWLLKHQPEIILINFDMFIDHLFNSYYPEDLPLLFYVKKYSFEDKIVDYCLEKLSKNETSDKLFIILAVLTPPEKFLQIIRPYYNETENAISVATSLKYTNNILTLPTMQYCQGDLLSCSLESLHYRFFHSSENQIRAFVNELSSKGYEFRKQSISLTCLVGRVTDVKNLLKFIESEHNAAVQEHLISAALKYFLKNPSEEFFDAVKICMTKLLDDERRFIMFVNVGQIPAKYQAQHVIFTWDILKTSERYRPKLLESIPSTAFRELPLGLVLEVTAETFPKSSDFVVNCLAESIHRNEVMDATFRLMTNQFQSLDEEKQARGFYSHFVDNLASSVRDLDTLRNFSQKWHRLFSATDAISEHLKLSLATLYLQSGGNFPKFSGSIREFFDGLISVYGLVVVDLFASEVKSTIRRFGTLNEEFFIFCSDLLARKNVEYYLLVLKLLPKQPSDGLFHEILQRLQQAPHESIQMLVGPYITDME